MFIYQRRLVDKPEKYVTEAFEPFKARLRTNWTRGFQALMKYDEFSVRGFMMSHGITPLYVLRTYYKPRQQTAYIKWQGRLLFHSMARNAHRVCNHPILT